MGFTLPYGGMQHVSSFDEVTPSMVNAALAGAKFLGNIFNKSKGESCFLCLMFGCFDETALPKVASIHHQL
jgi:hypothetical protein